MSKLTKLFEKMKTMPSKELEEYIPSAIIIGRVCNILGISAILFSLIVPNIYSYCITTIMLYVFVKAAINADNTTEYIIGILSRRKSGTDLDK